MYKTVPKTYIAFNQSNFIIYYNFSKKSILNLTDVSTEFIPSQSVQTNEYFI